MIEESTHQNNWACVLDQIEETLAQALHTVEQRQSSFEDYVSDSTANTNIGGSWMQGLQGFHERMEELVLIAERAAQSVQEVDAVLADEEQSLQQWMEEAETGKRKMADWLSSTATETTNDV